MNTRLLPVTALPPHRLTAQLSETGFNSTSKTELGSDCFSLRFGHVNLSQSKQQQPPGLKKSLEIIGLAAVVYMAGFGAKLGIQAVRPDLADTHPKVVETHDGGIRQESHAHNHTDEAHAHGHEEHPDHEAKPEQSQNTFQWLASEFQEYNEDNIRHLPVELGTPSGIAILGAAGGAAFQAARNAVGRRRKAEQND